ncbi:MAG: Crp/Fnr family transcriptional regulator [Prevotella sp.]|nr:Crp/Fnr family transcriptional regulator [Prevotella sp.]MDD5895985.1 Crp/Fnr family transcriptional regulator [Prevotellaceae bacterium]
MAELQLYDKLLQFPLFAGMRHGDIMELVAHTRLDFRKMEANKLIVQADTPCENIIMLVNGQIESTTFSADKGFSVIEVFNSPYSLQEENLFGVSQCYQSTFTTTTRCHFISINKRELVALFDKFVTIRLNYLNLLASKTQKTTQGKWLPKGNDNRSRVIHFLVEHSLRPAGFKTYNILMKRLAEEVNASRLEVSRELNKMEAEGLLTLSRGRVTVPFLERLVTL